MGAGRRAAHLWEWRSLAFFARLSTWEHPRAVVRDRHEKVRAHFIDAFLRAERHSC